MIKYNNNTIYDWNFDTSNVIKVYRNNAIVFYKVSGESPTPSQEPCFAVVENISLYQDREFVDVYDKTTEKWYKLNNLNQYEEYGVYGSGRSITYYKGKLTIDDASSSRLPQGYTEVEYIENTGTSYINTNIQVYSSTTDSFEIESKLIAAKHDSQSYQNVFSCMSEDGEPYQGFTYRYEFSSLTGRSIPNGQNTFTIVNNEDSTQTVTVTSSTSQRTYTHTYPLTLFCGLNSSRNPFRWTNSKFYYFKVKMNDELVRDLVPCKRDSDDKYGMYDIVNDVFYLSPNNVDFSGGEPVIEPTKTYEYEWNGSSWTNLGEVSGSTIFIKSPNYIERTSSANGYLPLGEYFTENTVIDIDFEMTQAKGNAIIGDYGSNDNDDWRVFLNYDSQVNNRLVYDFINSRNYYNTGDWSKRFHLEIGNYYIKDLNTGTYLLNESRKTSFTRPNQMYLFHMEGSQVTNNIDYGQIYYVKIYQDNLLVKDYIPWTDGNGTYGMWDKVSNLSVSSISNMTGSSIVEEVNVGSSIFPKYYENMTAPSDNLTFSTMADALAYQCPWVGMNVTIDNAPYLFGESYEWLAKYGLFEVSGEYTCDDGNKYKKMEEMVRNIDGSWSHQSPPIYEIGDLIEADSDDCTQRLPFGYTEVEWIGNETTGDNYYIDTQYKPNQNTRAVVVAKANRTKGNPRICGSGPWDGLAFVMNIEQGSEDKYYFKFGDTSSWYQTSAVADTNKHTFDLSQNGYYIDGVLAGTPATTTFQITTNFGLFNAPSIRNFISSETFVGNIYSCQIYENDVLVRDFVPCIRDNDLRSGMYDLVNDVFYSAVNTNYNFITGDPV